jgi:hypothetical protein
MASPILKPVHHPQSHHCAFHVDNFGIPKCSKVVKCLNSYRPSRSIVKIKNEVAEAERYIRRKQRNVYKAIVDRIMNY